MGKDHVILVVDDIEVNRSILCNILGQDYIIEEAANGLEALNALGKDAGRYSAILLDLIMPVMDGFTFLEKVAEDENYRNLPIIVSTSNGDPGSEKRALQLGAWDFVLKPYDPTVIQFRVKNAINRSQLSAFRQLKYLIEYDPLTGIYNKTKFFKETRHLLDTVPLRNFVFLRMDIDRFSLVNSYYGTTEGDRLLMYIATLLKEFSKKKSYFTYGRIEADVFAFCFSYETEEEIEEITESLSQSIKQYDISFDIVPIYGIYLVKNRNLSIDAMLGNANLAAKQIKGNYLKNSAYYSEKMGEAIEKEQEIINEMEVALKEKQFFVYLQPKYSLLTNEPSGAEALVRWMHPEKGMISPGIFIPIFERNGFIEKLDFYMWDQVCSLLKEWRQKGLDVKPISVNVSRVNLYNPKLVENICELTKMYEIPNHLLQLELTESAYTDNPKVIEDTIELLHQQGFTVLMDDFGSGYSSLNILKDMDVDIIKIDMGFFSESKLVGRGESIISSVVRMTKWLNIPTVAEGVETLDQVEFLRGIGCEYVQGYYFAKPMPVGDYEQLIKENKIFISNEENSHIDILTTVELNQVFTNIMQAAAVYEVNKEAIECVRVNNAYYELFGYEDFYMFSTQPLKSVDEDYKEILHSAFRELNDEKDTKEVEYARTCVNGQEKWIKMKLKYVNTISNKAVILATFYDMTAQKEMDLELQKYKLAVAGNPSRFHRILVVDDVDFSRDMIEDIFAPKEQVIKAKNGQEAIKMLEQYNYKVDIILLDMMMPVMNGTEFLEYKKNHREMVDIPVIIITSDDRPKLQVDTLSLGAKDYITKPFVQEVVMRRVENVITAHNPFEKGAGENKDC